MNNWSSSLLGPEDRICFVPFLLYFFFCLSGLGGNVPPRGRFFVIVQLEPGLIRASVLIKKAFWLSLPLRILFYSHVIDLVVANSFDFLFFV